MLGDSRMTPVNQLKIKFHAPKLKCRRDSTQFHIDYGIRNMASEINGGKTWMTTQACLQFKEHVKYIFVIRNQLTNAQGRDSTFDFGQVDYFPPSRFQYKHQTSKF